MFYLAFVCLSLCLLATSHKSRLSDILENFIRAISVVKEELITFWKSPHADPDPGTF